MSHSTFSLLHIWIAVSIGIAGTSVIHLSKGVMRLGIRDLESLRSSTSPGGKTKKQAALNYLLGISMNFTNPLWVIAANRFAPTVYYTSVYGLGLIPLLLFSRFVIGEKPGRNRIFGSSLIVIGTLIIGYTAISTISPSMYTASRSRALAISVIWLVVSLIGAITTKRWALHLQEFFFGTAAGGLAALEAVLKGIAQSGMHGNSFLPQTSENWVLFILSFLGAAGAFGLIQWSFHRSCSASVMGAAYNAAYILLPLLIVPFLLGEYHLNPIRISGALIIIAGSLFISLQRNRS